MGIINNGKPMNAAEISRDVSFTGFERLMLLRSIDSYRPPNIGMHRRLDDLHENLCGTWDWETVNDLGIDPSEQKMSLPFRLSRKNMEDAAAVIDMVLNTPSSASYAVGRALRKIQDRLKSILEAKEEPLPMAAEA
jgi:hypothetical protein